VGGKCLRSYHNELDPGGAKKRERKGKRQHAQKKEVKTEGDERGKLLKIVKEIKAGKNKLHGEGGQKGQPKPV